MERLDGKHYLDEELKCDKCGAVIGLALGNKLTFVTDAMTITAGPPVEYLCSCGLKTVWFGNEKEKEELDGVEPLS